MNKFKGEESTVFVSFFLSLCYYYLTSKLKGNMSHLVSPGQAVGVCRSTLERYYCRHLTLAIVLLFFPVTERELKCFMLVHPLRRLITKWPQEKKKKNNKRRKKEGQKGQGCKNKTLAETLKKALLSVTTSGCSLKLQSNTSTQNQDGIGSRVTRILSHVSSF